MSLISDYQNSENMRFIEVLGYQIRYLHFNKTNSNQTLVLLHGIGASADRWSKLWPYLNNYNVFIPDLIGFGYSEKPLVEYKIDFFVSFLKEFFDKLDITNPIIIGSSFGGQLVIEFSIRNKDFFKKIILVSPSGALDKPTYVLNQYIFSALYPTRENVEMAFNMMANVKDYKVDEITTRDFINRMKLPNAKYSLMSTLLALRKDHTLAFHLKEITIPVLLIWGREDTTIPVENIDYFKELPILEIHIMEECGHTPYVEKPEEFYKIIDTFINE